MMDKLDKYLDHVQKLAQIAEISQATGQENDPELQLDLEVADSGLSCAPEYLNRAYSHCVRTAVEMQFAPPTAIATIPPPPANMPFLIAGTEVETGAPVWFLLSAACEGITIVAMSGAGKSVTEARLLTRAPESVFLYGPDTKKDVLRIFKKLGRKYLYVRPQDLPFNLLDCPTNDPATYYSALIEKIASILMSDGQTWPETASVLAKVRESLPKDEPMISLNQAIQLFRELAAKKGKEKYNTFADRLTLLARTLGKNANLRKGAPFLNRYSALGLDFSGVSIQIRQAVEVVFLYQLMQSRLSRGFTKGVDVMVCYDESIETYSKSFNSVSGSGKVRFQEMFLNQSRSFNFGRIILAQFLSQLSESVLANTRVLIVLRLSDPTEARLAVRHLGLGDEYIPQIQGLPNGYAFIKSPNCPTVRIKVDYLDLGDFPSDGDIAQEMGDELKWIDQNSEYDTTHQDGSQIDADTAEVIAMFTRPALPETPVVVDPAEDAPVTLLADWGEFMQEVLANPESTSTQHGKNLGWGMYKTTRVKSELVDAGLVTVTKLKTAGRPAERLQVTRKGIASMGGLNS
jgi:hypothetical protein